MPKIQPAAGNSRENDTEDEGVFEDNVAIWICFH